MESTKQAVSKQTEGLVARAGDGGTKGVGVVVERNAGFSGVGTAEVASDSEPVIQVAGNRCVPAVQAAAVKSGVLISAEHLRLGLLGDGSQRNQCHQNRDACKFTHYAYLGRFGFAPRLWAIQTFPKPRY